MNMTFTDMDYLSEVFSIVLVISESKPRKKHKTTKLHRNKRTLRRLRSKWLKCGKTNEEIKQLAMEYHHSKQMKKQKYVSNLLMITSLKTTFYLIV